MNKMSQQNRRLFRVSRKIKRNPLLGLIPNVSVSKDVFTYTEHKQWELLESNDGCMKLFERWYSDNNKNYNHIKHAFNSLCKHYKLITIKKIVVKVDKKRISTLWTINSFNNLTWIYQVVKENLDEIAFKEGDRFILEEEDLEPISKLIEMVCS